MWYSVLHNTMMITQELPLMLMHMDGCTLESVLAFRRFVSDSSIRGVWQGWHHQINSSIIIVIITTPYCFYHYNYYRYNHCYYGQSSAPHVRCQKRTPFMMSFRAQISIPLRSILHCTIVTVFNNGIDGLVVLVSSSGMS